MLKLLHSKHSQKKQLLVAQIRFLLNLKIFIYSIIIEIYMLVMYKKRKV